MMLAWMVLALAVGGASLVFMRREVTRARQTARLATERMALAGHEMRTAVGAVAGLCELVRRQAQPPRTEELERLYAAARCAAELAGGVMDMSCAGRSAMRTQTAPLSLPGLLGEVEAVAHAQAVAAGVHLSVQADVCDDWIYGDGVRLRQVLINLAVNAIRFTPAGGEVCVHVSQRERGAECRFVVSDTGCGIDPGDRERIFEPYEQGDRGAAGDVQGLHAGIGLAVCRSSVERMGGRLGVDSEPGRGSRFYFALKLPAAQKPERKACGMLAGKSVLLAEDNALSATITRALLEREGMRVTVAGDGAQAVACFCAQGARAFDAVLLDLRMPVMDGLHAAQAIRDAARADGASVRIAALSASAEEEARALASGMDAYFVKPVDVDALGRFVGECGR